MGRSNKSVSFWIRHDLDESNSVYIILHLRERMQFHRMNVLLKFNGRNSDANYAQTTIR